MKSLLKTLAVVGLAVMLGASLLTSAYAAKDAKTDRPFSCLTEEQRDAVHEKITEMRKDEADPEEIHDAVRKMMEGYGVDVPEHFGRRGPRRALLSGLTEEQRDAVQKRIREMHKAGADREEIHAEVSGILKGYGIEAPGRMGAARGHRRVMSELTDEQRRAVEKRVKEMREAGATREEIHTQVSDMLKGYGVEVPGIERGLERRLAAIPELSDEQRQAVQKKVTQMREAGKSREEIHMEVRQMLRDYGVEIPDRPPRREGRAAFMAGLTEEQREAVHEKIEEMRKAGASREEIRAAVGEMLEAYGIDLPVRSGQMLKGNRSAAPRIQAQSYPNPATSEVNISYVLPAQSGVRVEIYNTAGQLVRSYDMGQQGAGSHSVLWDGKYDDGKSASSGMYLFRVDADSETVTDCLVLLK
jgi:DNA-binding transcriptional regulator YhcF (GntR family)